MKQVFRIPYKKSVSALIWLRTLDLFAILIIAGVAFFLLVRIELLAIVVLLSGIAMPLWLHSGFQGLLQRIARFRPQWHQHIDSWHQGLPVNDREIWYSWGWTLFNWTTKLLAFTLIFKWFIDIDTVYALIAILGAEITSVLPIHSIAGAGTYESGAILALSLLDVSASEAVIAAVNLHLFLIGMTVVTGLLAQVPFFTPGSDLPAADETNDSAEQHV